MIDQLFGSKTRVKLLYLFYGNPNRSFYVREITRKIDEQINSVRRELSNLLSINNRLYYEVSQNHEFYKPLHEIFSADSDSLLSSAQTTQEKRFRDIGKIKTAYLMGKYVRDKSMPVDLLIVGDVNKTKLEKLVAELQKEEGFEINYSLLSSKDFEYRKVVKDRFITDVMNAKKTIIIDEITTKGKE